MNVFQIYISENNQPMGPILGSYVESVKQNFNHLEHVLLDNNQTEGLLKGNFDGEVLSSYKK